MIRPALQLPSDDDRVVVGAGLALVTTLSERLETFALANQMIDPGDRPGHDLPGREVLTVVHAMVARAGCIDDRDVSCSEAPVRASSLEKPARRRWP
ncbi:MAG: hypothetical protein ACYCXA_08065 [Actinomycetes bacterium]